MSLPAIPVHSHVTTSHPWMDPHAFCLIHVTHIIHSHTCMFTNIGIRLISIVIECTYNGNYQSCGAIIILVLAGQVQSVTVCITSSEPLMDPQMMSKTWVHAWGNTSYMFTSIHFQLSSCLSQTFP